MTFNPLRYGDAALRHALYIDKPLPDGLPSLPLCFGVIGATALVMLFFASRAIHREAVIGRSGPIKSWTHPPSESS